MFGRKLRGRAIFSVRKPWEVIGWRVYKRGLFGAEVFVGYMWCAR